MKSLILGTALAAVLATSTFAQDNAPPPPPSGAESAAQPGPEGPPPGDMPPPGGPKGDHWRGPGGPGDRRGPPPPPPRVKGFELNYGRGVKLEVTCADEPIAACVEAAKPLIDKMPTFDAQMFPAGPPAPPPPPKK